MKRPALLLVCATILLGGGPAVADAPKVGIASFAELKRPLPHPYEPNADADAQVTAAAARAKTQHKLLLITLGGNWCTDSRILAGAMDMPEVKRFVRAHYEVVTVDVGQFDKNLQIPARYGLTQRLKGVPTVLIVDPVRDKLVNAGEVSALTDARHMAPHALVDWLAKWARD